MRPEACGIDVVYTLEITHAKIRGYGNVDS